MTRKNFSRLAGWLKVTVCAVLLSAAITTTAGHAQDATSGSISGVVTDANGELVKGATVTLTNTDRNQVRTVTTNSKGAYTATSLPLGHYSVTIEDAGFSTLR